MHDFSLEKSEKIENIGKVSLYVHKNGGRAVCIDNEDENRVFSLCFDTPAYDDTGIAHILEHCVLCGSEKYPAKDPFNLLDANVPHTYLNAITFTHKTLFPVASTDEKALMLMAGVYCDGVFDPLVCENKGIFMQEGGFYDGKKIKLNENLSLDPAEFPCLKNYIGNDFIVTDGKTLLGADDKAGIAEIMTAMEFL
ncbi:MAG: hypothetical protein IJL89_11610, partial [Firmicutes bacterium]|nr:hypothetical protein [Bacillota bacterium]